LPKRLQTEKNTMLQTVIATKLGMSQGWTNTGKRVAITRCKVDNNLIVGQQPTPQSDDTKAVFEIGYGARKLKNMTKPLQGKMTKGGFSVGVKGIKGVRVSIEEGQELPKVGDTITVENVLEVGDVVQVQGTSKGRGFAGGIKRHGFHGGPKTHGQSDRERAVGSIGAGTYPGRVWKGKKMPGHYGVETKSVTGLVVLYIDPETQEVWLSGPVPGSIKSAVTIMKTGKKKEIALDTKASGIPEKPAAEAAEENAEAANTKEETTQETT
jgi:large subunit ribosomal protein L3